MSRTSRMIGALALLALIGAGVAWAVVSGNGSDQTTAASIPRAAPPRPAHHEPRLELSRRGQPIVWLRHGAKIPIRSSPGGKVIKTLRWRTQFDSRTVLAVFRHQGRWAGVPTPLLPDGQLGWPDGRYDTAEPFRVATAEEMVSAASDPPHAPVVVPAAARPAGPS